MAHQQTQPLVPYAEKLLGSREYKKCNTPEQEAQQLWDKKVYQQPAHSNVRRYIGSGEDVMLEML